MNYSGSGILRYELAFAWEASMGVVQDLSKHIASSSGGIGCGPPSSLCSSGGGGFGEVGGPVALG